MSSEDFGLMERNEKPTTRLLLRHYLVYVNLFLVMLSTIFTTVTSSVSTTPHHPHHHCTGSVERKKREKYRFTVLLCSNADGTDKVRPLVIGTAHRPRCFQGRTPGECGFDYAVYKKSWMTTEIFFEWLKRFDEHIGTTEGRRCCC